MTEEKTASLIGDAKEIGENILTGDDPVTAIVKTVDDNKDGKITLNEVRYHRWTILLVLIGVGFGMLIGNPSIVKEFVVNHYMALVGMFISFWVGWSAYWMFKEKY